MVVAYKQEVLTMGIVYKTKTFSEIYDSAEAFVNDAKNNFSMLDNISDDNKTILYYLLFGRYGNSPISNWDEYQFKTKLFSIMFQYGPTWQKKMEIQNTLRGLQLADLIDDGSLHELFEHTGSQNSSKTGTGSDTRSVTESGTNTGTVTTAKTGTQGISNSSSSTVEHDNTVNTDNVTTNVDNHASNPSVAPSTPSDPYAPLDYIDEQRASKNVLDGESVQDETTQTTSSGTSTTTNNLQDQTTNNLANSRTGSITDQSSTSDEVEAEDSSNNETTRTLTQGKLKAYEKLLDLLAADVTAEFLAKFRICFKQFVGWEHPLIYVEEE